MSSTAFAAAASLCGASTISKRPMSRRVLARHGRNLRSRADQDRNDDAGLRRLDGAAQRGFVARMRHDRGRGGTCFARAISRSYF